MKVKQHTHLETNDPCYYWNLASIIFVFNVTMAKMVCYVNLSLLSNSTIIEKGYKKLTISHANWRLLFTLVIFKFPKCWENYKKKVKN